MTLEEFRTQTADLRAAARAAFLTDIDRTLAELRVVAESLVTTIGEVSPREAYTAWCTEMSAVLRATAEAAAPKGRRQAVGR